MDRDSTFRPVHRAVLLAPLLAVIVVDQASKWWAWRHVPQAQINYGGDVLVGATLSRWYAGPATGALLDLLDVGLLGLALVLLVRGRRPARVLVTGALTLGGWVSNLLDRLGLHYLTAPGSVRGVVDFLPLGQIRYNVADLFITGGTLLFLVAVGTRARPRPAAPLARRRVPGWIPAAAVACLVVAVGAGAVNDSGTTVPEIAAATP
jgi:lipoprotein signal peptidase